MKLAKWPETRVHNSFKWSVNVYVFLFYYAGSAACWPERNSGRTKDFCRGPGLKFGDTQKSVCVNIFVKNSDTKALICIINVHVIVFIKLQNSYILKANPLCLQLVTLLLQQARAST